MAELPRAKDVRAYAVGLLLLLAMPAVLPPWAGAEEVASESARAVAAPGDRQALLDFYHRYRKAEAEEERSMLSEDARWLNAFGRVMVGRDAIMAWEAHLQASPGYAASHVSRQDDPEIRFLRPDVAIIHEYHEREGQIIDGVVTPTRRVNTTYVLTLEEGAWLVRDKVTMDERQRPDGPASPPPAVASPEPGDNVGGREK